MTEKSLSKLMDEALSGQMSQEDISQAVNQAAGNYYHSPVQKFEDRLKDILVEEALVHLRPGRVLDLGYINTLWTQALLDRGITHIDIVEGAQTHADNARRDWGHDPRVRVFHSLFEAFEPDEPYDTILMSGVVKHVPDDKGLVRRARSWLKPGGVIIASTPNSRAFHRRLGTYMGMELAPDRHNATDRSVFNVHLYDRFSWRALFVEAGYDVFALKGIVFKILSAEQLMYLSSRYDVDRMIEGLRQLGDELQDYAWYLVLAARADEETS
ncbi:MAG: class I SAM-dependent methyltransferase [Alphaproteobacteria bacterium]|nr:class I SAM-dependent methyltransferase [Alphaproteobacteria bacterium]